MSARQKDLLKQIEYPESDGQPMGETDQHILLMMNLRFALDEYFRAVERVYVGSNLMCYYVEGDPTKSISPDVFVALGAAKGERRVYKFWEEPAPNVVLELSSRKTRKDDFGWKKEVYAWLGVKEYFVFNPEAKLRSPLRAFRLHGTELVEEMVVNQRVRSHELGLDLVTTGGTLRLYNARTGTFLLTPAESYARAAEETVRAAEEAARATQEAARATQEAARATQEAARATQEAARADRLAAKLRELGLDPDQL
jgi:Uma2 family endonuclease